MKRVAVLVVAIWAWLPAAGAAQQVWAGRISSPAESAQQVTADIADADLRAYLGTLELEARLDADLTGDGVPEVVYVAADRNERVLGVLEGASAGAGLGERSLGEGRLSPWPRSSVTLGFSDGQLQVEQIAGEGIAAESGTGEAEAAVVVSRYRFGFDPVARRPRLLMLAAEHYDKAPGQGTTRVEWNLDSGEYLVTHGQPVILDTGEPVYVYSPADTTTRPGAPLYLSELPDPLAMLKRASAKDTVASRAHGEGGTP